MGIGTSIFLIAAGAILYFAVDADISGLDISTVGLVLMACGALGLVLSLVMFNQRSARDGRGAHRSCAIAKGR